MASEDDKTVIGLQEIPGPPDKTVIGPEEIPGPPDKTVIGPQEIPGPPDKTVIGPQCKFVYICKNTKCKIFSNVFLAELRKLSQKQNMYT